MVHCYNSSVSPRKFSVVVLALHVVLLLSLSSAAFAQTTILSETFEADFPSDNGWSVDDADASGTVAYWDDVASLFGGEVAHGGSRMGYCAGIGYGGTDSDPTYQTNMSAFMQRSIDLRGFTNATLSFWYRIPSNEACCHYFRAILGDSEIGTWTEPTSDWVNYSVGLEGWLDGVHTLKFEFTTDDSGGAEGVYLDDILVSAEQTATPNDQCPGSIPLSEGSSYLQDTTGATSDGDPPGMCFNGPEKGVWFQFTPSLNGEVTVDTCGSDFDTVVQVFTGTCDLLLPLADGCNDDAGPACAGLQASVAFNGLAGTTYYILAGGYGDAGGMLRIQAVVQTAGVSNDFCSGAIALEAGTAHTMDTTSATSTNDPVPACVNAFGNGVWFTFIPSVDGQVTVDTCMSSFDTVLQVYAGTCGTLSPVSGGCNDNNGLLCPGTNASVRFAGTAGATYYILAGGFGGASGSLVIIANVIREFPDIRIQPLQLLFESPTGLPPLPPVDQAAWTQPAAVDRGPRGIVASPHAFEESQPDGTRVKLFVRGTPKFHWLEDIKGYTVIRHQGAFAYARRDERGQLAPASLWAGKDDPEEAGLQPHTIPSPEVVQRRQALRGPARPELSQPPQPIEPRGTLKNVVVLMRFSDHAQRILPTASDIDIIFNAVGGDPALAPSGSVRDFFFENSYGTMTLASTVFAWVTLPRPEAYYADGSRGLSPRVHEAIIDALNLADPLIDFSQFDNDGDGFVDLITFLHSGYGAEWGGTDMSGAFYTDRIWSHRWAIPAWTSEETINVSDYDINPSLWGRSGSEPGHIGVICHETGHLLGLPDLYDTDDSSAGIGSWCLMANPWGFTGDQLYPPHFSAWCKIFLGWVSPTMIPGPGAYSAPQAETIPTVFRVNHGFSTGEYLLIENRQPVGFDSRIPQGGLAIWHIDETKAGNTEEGYPGQGGWPGNNNHYRIALLQADGRYDLEHGNNRGDDGDLYHGSRVFAVGPDTVPNTDAYLGGNVQATLNRLFDISAAGSSMSFSHSIEFQPYSFVIYNEGGADLNVTSIAPETPAPWISWIPEAPFTIPVGGSRSVNVSVDFTNAPSGQSTTRLLVVSTDPDESPYPDGVSVIVRKLTAAEIAVALGTNDIVNGQPTPIDFGNVQQGQTGPELIFVVRNDGDKRLVLDGLTVPAFCTVTKSLPPSLEPRTQDTFIVRLNTDSAGTNMGAIVIESNDFDENPFTFPITGTVVAQTRIIILTGDLTFGETRVGSSQQRTLTISNTGNSTLTVTNIRYPEGFAGDWSGAVTAGGSQDVMVTFSPTVAIGYGGSVTVESDATDGTNTVVASGLGTSDSVPPNIVTQPSSRTNVPGSSLMFSVSADGTEPLAYQWFKDGAPLSGATERIYVLTGVQSSNAGIYTVGVSNIAGGILSSNAELTVLPVDAPSVIAGPLINPVNGHAYYLLAQSTWIEAETAAQTLGGHLATLRSAEEQEWMFTQFSTWAGQERNLWIGLYDLDPTNNAASPDDRRTEFVWASGEAVTYTNWSGGEPNNYRELGEYYVHTLSSSAGSWNDAWDTDFNEIPLHGVVEVVRQGEPPAILVEPRPRTNVVGSHLMLSVTVTGTEPLTYQWFKDEAAVPGATGRTFVLANIQSADGGIYHVTISNQVGSVRSAGASLTALPAKIPSVLAGPILNPANGHDYYLLDQSTWVEAEAAAQALGGHLTTLRSAAEQEWVVMQFGARDGQERNLWIGLRDPDPMNNASNGLERRIEFLWTSGEPVTYVNWNVSEPNNYQELGEYYVHTLPRSEPTGASTWNDTWDTDSNQGPLHGVVELATRRVQAVSRGVEGQVQLTLSGSAGDLYDIEASTNLVHWQSIGTVSNVNGAVEFYDVETNSFNQRFFRFLVH